MNRQLAWEMIANAGKLASEGVYGNGNEKAAGLLLGQAGLMLENPDLIAFSEEIRRESCRFCGAHIFDDPGLAESRRGHADGCPKIVEPVDGKIERGDGQADENFVRTFGPPGHAG